MKIFDSHFHVIDKKFPLISNNGFLPEEFTYKNYLESINKYNIKGGVVVSGSFQGFDQNYLINALEKLGKDYVGVTNLKHDVSDEEVLKLYNHRIRAVRFNIFRGGSENIKYIESFANRIYELCNMHVELYIDSPNIKKYFSLLKSLPKISIDHLGLKYQDHEYLLKLVENGAHVKATGFMRVDFDVKEMLLEINKINPGALMFGTDLPGTRAARIFNNNDLLIIKNNFAKEDQKNILYNNGISFYKLKNNTKI